MELFHIAAVFVTRKTMLLRLILLLIALQRFIFSTRFSNFILVYFVCWLMICGPLSPCILH